MRLKKLWYFIILACCWGGTLCVPRAVINQVKSALLPMFGFKDRPKVASGVEVPDELKRIYQIQTNFDYETASLPLPGMNTQSANTVRSFRHIETEIDARFPHQHKFRLFFNVSTIPKDEVIHAAILKLTRAPATKKRAFQRVLVQDILRRGKKHRDGPHLVAIDSTTVDTSLNATLDLNVVSAVNRWRAHPHRNFGLLVTVFGGGGAPPLPHVRLRRAAAAGGWAQQQPLLLAFTDDGKNAPRTGRELLTMRRKRAPRRSRKSDPCRRRAMYVDFQEVGWSDWIVAPLGYDAFYCAGDCEYPMAEHMNTTNHAIVQILMNSARPTEVPKPCCVPTNLAVMSMLYLGGNGGDVILKNYKEMVVHGCGCR